MMVGGGRCGHHNIHQRTVLQLKLCAFLSSELFSLIHTMQQKRAVLYLLASTKAVTLTLTLKLLILKINEI